VSNYGYDHWKRYFTNSKHVASMGERYVYIKDHCNSKRYWQHTYRLARFHGHTIACTQGMGAYVLSMSARGAGPKGRGILE
jgi:hypothetical protein